MDIVNIQALISENKVVDLASIDSNNTYLQLGVYQVGNRKRSSGNANAYAPYVITVAELLSGIGPVVPVSNNGLTVTAGVTQLGGTLIKNTSINIAGFNFTVTNGANLSVDFKNRLLADASGVNSINWTSREMYDSTGTAAALWNLRILSDSLANNSVDWDARLLYNPTGVAVLNWTGTLASVQVTGTTNNSTTYPFRVYNSTPTDLFSVHDDGLITINGGNGFNGTFELHQRAGTTHVMTAYNASYSKALFFISDNGVSGGVSMAANMLNVDAYGGGVGINIGAPSAASGTLLRINRTLAGADTFAVTGFANGGFYIKDTANEPFVYMQDSAAATKVQIHTSGDSFFNGGKVSMTALPTSNAGLATGDLYVDTAANILGNGDKVVGWKV